MIQYILMASAFASQHNDTLSINIPKQGEIQINDNSKINESCKRIELESGIMELQKISSKTLSKFECSIDTDTLDMYIVIDNISKKMNVRNANEYEENGTVDSLLKCSKKISKKFSSQNVIKIKFLTNCKLNQ